MSRLTPKMSRLSNKTIILENNFEYILANKILLIEKTYAKNISC